MYSHSCNLHSLTLSHMDSHPLSLCLTLAFNPLSISLSHFPSLSLSISTYLCMDSARTKHAQCTHDSRKYTSVASINKLHNSWHNNSVVVPIRRTVLLLTIDLWSNHNNIIYSCTAEQIAPLERDGHNSTFVTIDLLISVERQKWSLHNY